MSNRVESEPSDISIERGLVIVDGPGGVAVTLTQGAAEKTGRRLIDAGARVDRRRLGVRHD